MSLTRDTDPEINPKVFSAIQKANILDFASILSLSCGDIQRKTHLSLIDIQNLKETIARKVYPGDSITAWSLLAEETSPDKLPTSLSTGCNVLDKLLNGGLLCPGINEITGESACGKTQFCLQLCLTVQLPAKVGGFDSGAVYICTEDVFPDKRLNQMIVRLKERNIELQEIKFTDNIFIEHASDLDTLKLLLSKRVPLLLKYRPVKLLVIDSIAALFRCEFGLNDRMKRTKGINQFGALLRKISNQFRCTVVCVNQVTANMGKRSSQAPTNSDSVIPALGIGWSNWVTVRLMMKRTHSMISQECDGNNPDRTPLSLRTLEVIFGPHIEKTCRRFVIDKDGLKGYD